MGRGCPLYEIPDIIVIIKQLSTFYVIERVRMHISTINIVLTRSDSNA